MLRNSAKNYKCLHVGVVKFEYPQATTHHEWFDEHERIFDFAHYRERKMNIYGSFSLLRANMQNKVCIRFSVVWNLAPTT